MMKRFIRLFAAAGAVLLTVAERPASAQAIPPASPGAASFGPGAGISTGRLVGVVADTAVYLVRP